MSAARSCGSRASSCVTRVGRKSGSRLSRPPHPRRRARACILALPMQRHNPQHGNAALCDGCGLVFATLLKALLSPLKEASCMGEQSILRCAYVLEICCRNSSTPSAAVFDSNDDAPEPLRVAHVGAILCRHAQALTCCACVGLRHSLALGPACYARARCPQREINVQPQCAAQDCQRRKLTLLKNYF